jgi:hypothetical protein
MARTLDDIVAALKLGKRRNTGCTLLLGAGCSKTAGIPLASGIVDQIRNSPNYSRVYQRALDRARASNAHAVIASYGDCMAEMDHGDQRELIRGYIDAANLNWAHAGIAALIKHGYVGRVLTTNFDPLVARACAVFNELPAVYDLTMSEIRNYKELPDKAIFHLHGQRYGFSMLNDPDELEKHKSLIKPLFEHAREMRTWIVCGYSGENDPLFELIKACDRYDHALYWIGRDHDAPDHLQPLLSGKTTKGCHYLPFAGADEFFLRLCGALEIADFPFMHRPLDHIEELLGQFVDFPTAATDQGIDLLQAAKAAIGEYKKRINNVPSQEEADQKVAEMIATQSLESVLSAVSEDSALAARLSPDTQALLISMEGTALYKKAEESRDTAQRIDLYQKASVKYASALAIKPDLHNTLNNWGNALAKQAKLSTDSEAHRYWAEAGEKYAAALAIKPDKHETLYNWGIALNDHAERSPDDAAYRLWAEAGNKYAAVLAIKPDKHEALYNWGYSLDAQARRSPQDEARRLWAEAGKKYAAALAIKPDKRVLNNWSAALIFQAQRNDGMERDRLIDEAYQKCLLAVNIAPGESAYNLACIHAMRGELDNMTHWLDTSHAAGKLPTREHIAADKDFDSVRETPQFKAWLAKMGWLD